MSEEENKAGILNFLSELNKPKLTREPINELVAPNWVYHGPGGITAKGPAGFVDLDNIVHPAFPDQRMDVEEIIAEGDTVAWRYTFTCTHTGPLMGMAPTGRKVKFQGVIIDHYKGKKQVESFEFYDMLGFYQQLGILPQNIPVWQRPETWKK